MLQWKDPQRRPFEPFVSSAAIGQFIVPESVAPRVGDGGQCRHTAEHSRDCDLHIAICYRTATSDIVTAGTRA